MSEKALATHSSGLAWRIPGMGEPGGLPSMGSHRFGHDWSDLAAAAAIKRLEQQADPWTTRKSLDSKEIQPVHPKGNQYWIFTGRTDAETETPVLWPPDEKTWLTEKDPGAGKDWRQEEWEYTEDEMVGWHHWLNGHEFDYTLGVGDAQGSLVCCSPRGHKESDTTEWLNWTEVNYPSSFPPFVYT